MKNRVTLRALYETRLVEEFPDWTSFTASLSKDRPSEREGLLTLSKIYRKKIEQRRNEINRLSSGVYQATEKEVQNVIEDSEGEIKAISNILDYIGYWQEVVDDYGKLDKQVRDLERDTYDTFSEWDATAIIRAFVVDLASSMESILKLSPDSRYKF